MAQNSQKRLNTWLASLGRALLRRLDTPRKAYEKRIVNNLDNLYRVIRKGDVVLVGGRSELSRIIQLLTQSSWSHSAFYVGDALDGEGAEMANRAPPGIEGTDRRHMLIEADTASGVTAVHLRKYCDDNIRICRPFGIFPEDLEAVAAEVIGNLGRHYDHQNIIDLKSKSPWREFDRGDAKRGIPAVAPRRRAHKKLEALGAVSRRAALGNDSSVKNRPKKRQKAQQDD
jgi:hypothetical protein